MPDLSTINGASLVSDPSKSVSSGLDVFSRLLNIQKFQQQQQNQQAINPLVQAAMGGDQSALSQLAAIGSQGIKAIQDIQGLQKSRVETQKISDEELLRSVGNAAMQLQGLPDDRWIPFLQDRKAKLESQGRDATDTNEVLGLLQAGRTDEAKSLVNNAVSIARSAGVLTGGEFQKGRTVLTRTPDGKLALTSNVFDPASGGFTTSTTPVEGELVSTLGETAGEQTVRKVGEAGAIAGTQAGIQLRTKPQIEAAVDAAKAAVKTEVDAAGAAKGKSSALRVYEAGMKSLADSLGATTTGPGLSLFPAITAEQQKAEGARAVMAPVLKSIFRESGEGVFTDKDQDLLMGMLPSRGDNQEAIKSKLEMVDAVVKLKLGVSDTAPGTDNQPVTRLIFNPATGQMEPKQ